MTLEEIIKRIEDDELFEQWKRDGHGFYCGCENCKHICEVIDTL